jgi:hypothetical protein
MVVAREPVTDIPLPLDRGVLQLTFSYLIRLQHAIS